METLPQLRVRTEFSFGQVFGRIPAVVATLEGCPAAGIVDGGTWGHVRWEQATKKAGIRPMFGTEVVIPQEDGRRPVAWVLAEDIKQFYAFSTAIRQKDAPTKDLLASSPGIIRFAGAGLTDPALFDYVDINPASALVAKRSLALAERTGKPLVVTSDNSYPRPEDYPAFMAFSGRERVSPQHLLTAAELKAALGLKKRQWDAAVRDCLEIAQRAACDLPTAPIIHFPGDLPALVEEGKRFRLEQGHLREWTPTHQARLERELALIAQKDYASYFLVVADLVTWAKRHMLVGPGRGSSAGSLVCYLLRITEIDPLEHDLLFERFIDVNRSDLPDIDIDFSDTKREMCFEYLAQKYGRKNVARIGSINSLRARSVIGKVCDRLGIPSRDKFDVMDVLIEYSSGDSRYGHSLEDTLTQTEPGKRFAAKYPEASLMFALEGHASHTGVHAAGVVVCNEPVSHFCTVGAEGVAQLDKPDGERLGLLKIDALGLRTLGVIEDANVVTGDDLYALKLNDPNVFEVFNARHYAGIFQFEGQAQRRVAAEIQVDSFLQLDHITALARPGPLGGGASQKYIARAAGREDVTFRHPSMAAYLADTKGVVLYQEQVMRICFEMGRFSWEVVSEIRKAMSGRKGKEYFDRRGDEFVAGAESLGIPRRDAETIWHEICTFGAWGMNKAHTVSYSVISYWCAWLKAYHPLEYLAAALRNAKDDEQTFDLLREAVREGVNYVAFDIDRSQVDWQVMDGALIGGFKNLVGYGPAKAAAAVEQRRLGKLNREKVLAAEVKFSEPFPMHAKYGAAYDDPTTIGCAPGSHFNKLDELPPDGPVLLLAKVLRKELRDENETVRVARRDGKKLPGQTSFLDVFVTDDSGVPLTLRFDRFIYPKLGAPAAEKLKPGDVLLVRGNRIPNFAMVKVKKIKCLTNPEVFGA